MIVRSVFNYFAYQNNSGERRNFEIEKTGNVMLTTGFDGTVCISCYSDKIAIDKRHLTRFNSVTYLFCIEMTVGRYSLSTH